MWGGTQARSKNLMEKDGAGSPSTATAPFVTIVTIDVFKIICRQQFTSSTPTSSTEDSDHNV